MSEEINDEALEHFRIATAFESGSHGKTKDPVQAALHMIKAAEGGHQLAVYNVCAFYLHGRGLPQDLERARAWAMKLKALGSTEFADQAFAAIAAKEEALSKGVRAPSVAIAPERGPDHAKQAPLKGSPFWPPILFLGGLGLLVYGAGKVDSDYPGLGRSMIGWVGVLGALGVLLNIIWGRTSKETVKNFAGLMRGVAATILSIFLVGSIGYCSGGGRSSDGEGLGDVPDQVRKP